MLANAWRQWDAMRDGLRRAYADAKRPREEPVEDPGDASWSRRCRCVVDLVADEERRRGDSVATFSRDLDDLLGGGVPLGSVTEICGPPGVGKTQMCMQVAASAHLPQVFGGAGGACLYVDTEGSFVPMRFKEIVGHAVDHVRRIVEQQAELCAAEELSPLRRAAEEYSVDAVLNDTLHVRVTRVDELCAVVFGLGRFVAESSERGATTRPIRMVILDSMAFPFRGCCATPPEVPVPPANRLVEETELSAPQRSRLLFSLGQELSRVASQWNLAVITSNQMASRPPRGKQGAEGGRGHRPRHAEAPHAHPRAWGKLGADRCHQDCSPSAS